MIELLDGPAAGKILDLQRAPLLLRVVIGPRGAVDALDQLGDEPHAKETIHVYRRINQATRYHLKMRCRSQSGWRASAQYELLDEQPDQETARETSLWRAWAVEAARQWKDTE